MREQLGILVVEMPNGKVGFQAAEDTDELADSFANMVGRPGQEQQRATVLALKWKDGKLEVSGDSKTIPEPPKEPAWGHRIGVGAMDEPEEKEDGDTD